MSEDTSLFTKEKNIYHMRGDTGELAINITKNGVAYTMVDGDTAVFSVKKNVVDSTYLFQKNLSGNKIIFSHADTKDLEFGDYFYDIQINFSDGQVKTLGPYRYFLLADITTS
jgi:hypothetical protein